MVEYNISPTNNVSLTISSIHIIYVKLDTIYRIYNPSVITLAAIVPQSMNNAARDVGKIPNPAVEIMRIIAIL